MAKIVQPYGEKGVLISKSSIGIGDKVTLTYDGLLAKSGASTVIAHIGFGDAWDGKDYIPMENDGGVFKADIKVALDGSLNVAFKDTAENWDNNSGENYSFKITKKAKKAPAAETGEVVEEVLAPVKVRRTTKKSTETAAAAEKKPRAPRKKKE